MAAHKKIVLVQNLDSLVAGTNVPPKIFHVGITPDQLGELRGCVRKSDPNDFWHHGGSLEQWVGQQVLLVLRRGNTELARELRVIESMSEKPAEEVTEADLEGTLAAIAMSEGEMTFLEFFRDVHGGKDLAMVIRVRKPWV